MRISLRVLYTENEIVHAKKQPSTLVYLLISGAQNGTDKWPTHSQSRLSHGWQGEKKDVEEAR